MSALLTRDEWRRVETYDRETARQIEEQEHPLQPKPGPSIYEVLEAEGLENIRDYAGEIAFFQGLRERNTDDGRLVQWADFFISYYKNVTENQYDDIKRWRRESGNV